VLAVTAAAVLLLAGPASAHVTVGADDAHQGAADSVLTFRVPNEQDGASTVKVTIAFPKATPLASVKPGPKPGWTIATTTGKFATPITTDDGTLTEGVSQVVWTASSPAAGIPAGQFDSFQVLVGPLPAKATTLSFPTVQTYSNGKVTSWIEPVTDPAHEPDNPAPTLHLLAAAADSGAASELAASPAVASGVAVAASPATTPSASSSGQDGSARTLAVTALAVAVIGVLVGAGGIVMARRSR
jgi:uncharacterized protein YcnI